MTTRNPAVVDSEDFSVRRSIRIAAPIESVWTAITAAEHLSRWLGDRMVLDDVVVGGTGVISWDDAGDFPVRIEELDPPHVIAYRWSNDQGGAIDPARVVPERSTVFRFTLEVEGEGTLLTVVETGFDSYSDPAASMEDHRGGWDFELDELVAYVEGAS